ncbi:hypothetical protein [Senegalia massiliensis]|uniref:Uncharacterized protein n=1 Tax=Senegalia massiliensis TaxID=1720316 RepID=A0A845R521_9CLOT|nr:hypothetical protein [Senegalia massiliensis]NBI07603.1 hypothetical protein [Senegalia massiliensis]
MGLKRKLELKNGRKIIQVIFTKETFDKPTKQYLQSEKSISSSLATLVNDFANGKLVYKDKIEDLKFENKYANQENEILKEKIKLLKEKVEFLEKVSQSEISTSKDINNLSSSNLSEVNNNNEKIQGVKESNKKDTDIDNIISKPVEVNKKVEDSIKNNNNDVAKDKELEELSNLFSDESTKVKSEQKEQVKNSGLSVIDGILGGNEFLDTGYGLSDEDDIEDDI